jgi:hypothetical protein
MLRNAADHNTGRLRNTARVTLATDLLAIALLLALWARSAAKFTKTGTSQTLAHPLLVRLGTAADSCGDTTIQDPRH